MKFNAGDNIVDKTGYKKGVIDNVLLAHHYVVKWDNGSFSVETEETIEPLLVFPNLIPAKETSIEDIEQAIIEAELAPTETEIAEMQTVTPITNKKKFKK